MGRRRKRAAAPAAFSPAAEQRISVVKLIENVTNGRRVLLWLKRVPRIPGSLATARDKLRLGSARIANNALAVGETRFAAGATAPLRPCHAPAPSIARARQCPGHGPAAVPFAFHAGSATAPWPRRRRPRESTPDHRALREARDRARRSVACFCQRPRRARPARAKATEGAAGRPSDRPEFPRPQLGQRKRIPSISATTV